MTVLELATYVMKDLVAPYSPVEVLWVKPLTYRDGFEVMLAVRRGTNEPHMYGAAHHFNGKSMKNLVRTITELARQLASIR